MIYGPPLSLHAGTSSTFNGLARKSRTLFSRGRAIGIARSLRRRSYTVGQGPNTLAQSIIGS